MSSLGGECQTTAILYVGAVAGLALVLRKKVSLGPISGFLSTTYSGRTAADSGGGG